MSSYFSCIVLDQKFQQIHTTQSYSACSYPFNNTDIRFYQYQIYLQVFDGPLPSKFQFFIYRNQRTVHSQRSHKVGPILTMNAIKMYTISNNDPFLINTHKRYKGFYRQFYFVNSSISINYNVHVQGTVRILNRVLGLSYYQDVKLSEIPHHIISLKKRLSHSSVEFVLGDNLSHADYLAIYFTTSFYIFFY